MSNVLETKELTRIYHQGGESLTVLHNVDVEVKAGEIVALVGPSGSGKSTFLQSVGLLDKPTAGEIIIGGESVKAMNDNKRTALRREKIGFVYQFHYLLPEFSALENVVIPQMVAGVKKDEAEKRAKELLDILKLSHRIDHRPARLSGGEQQRVAIAQWKWSFREALALVLDTYIGDWGRDKITLQNFLKSNPNISKIEQENITGLSSGKGQAIIFIHGSPGNAMRWEWFLKNPPDNMHIIAIDRMGFGERGDKEPNLEKDFEALSLFVSQFEKPILIGHSLGGALVTRLATHCDIGGAVLVASSIDPMLERVLLIQKLGNSPFIKWILSRSVRNSNDEMIQLFNFMMKTESHLGKISVPIHAVHTKDDYLVPFAHIDYAQKHFNQFDLTSLEEGGHSIPWTRPDLVVNAIESVRKAA